MKTCHPPGQSGHIAAMQAITSAAVAITIAPDLGHVAAGSPPRFNC